MINNMGSIAAFVYCGALVVLWLKYLVAVAIQGKERFRERKFRYREDANCWQGDVAPDSELCARAQNLLRNDTESQPYFLALGCAYLLLNAWPPGAPVYFGCYAISRVAHAYFLLRAKQPHRTIAFGFGVTVCAILAIHGIIAGAVTLRG